MLRPSVGLAYSSAAAGLVRELADELGHVEFPYELLVRDEAALDLARRVPAILHCASLSLASGRRPTPAAIDAVERMADGIASWWLGEHLALISASCTWIEEHPHGEPVYDIGFAISPPMNDDTVDSVAVALAAVAERTDRPVLLENGPVYLATPGVTISQGEVLRRIVDRTGAGVLLDLAHLLITCQTLGLDPVGEVEQMPLEHVREVHVSGVCEDRGVLWDDHSSRPPDVEYELLRIVLDRAPVEAITHEYNWQPVVSSTHVRAELGRTRALVDGRSTAPV